MKTLETIAAVYHLLIIKLYDTHSNPLDQRMLWAYVFNNRSSALRHVRRRYAFASLFINRL